MPESSPVKRHKGKLVLLAVAAALAAYVIIGHAGIAWFDATDKHDGAAEAIKDAEGASVQWLTYLSRSGRADTDEGKRAAAELARGAESREAGKIEEAQRAYLAAWQAYTNAFRAEADVARKLWEAEIATPWRESLEGRFPFDRSSSQEAAPADLARLVHPIRGTIWTHRARFEAMAGAEFAGVRFVSAKELAAFLKAAEGLRDALFTEREDGVSLEFQVAVLGVPSGREFRLTLGGQSAVLIDGDETTLQWNQGYGGSSAAFTATNGEAESVLMDFMKSEWGILRVLWKCGLRESEGARSVWIMQDSRLPQDGELALTVRHGRKSSPFDPATYAAFKAPLLD